MSKFTDDLLKSIIQASANITEYRVLNSRVAQVIVQVSSGSDRHSVCSSLTDQLKSLASPVEDSFRWLQKGSSMIGYIAACNSTRVLETDKLDSAKYRLIASNMYLDNSDKTLWELKSTPGSSQKYLSRQGHDDLSELVEATRVPPRGSMPRLHSIVNAHAAPKTLVAFVNSIGLGKPNVDYGFCIGSNDKGTILACADYNHPVLVSPFEIVGVYNVNPQEIQQIVTAAIKKTTAAGEKLPTQDSIEYYKKLYSYAPDYLKKVIKEVQEQSAL